MESEFKILCAVVGLLAGTCTIVDFTNNHVISKYIFGNTKQSNNNTKKNKTKEKFTPEQELVDFYIPLCKNDIFSIDTWLQHSKKELYYIRNGIYAYNSMRFKSHFYDKFEWYEGNISPENFKEGILNYYEERNISIILDAETLRYESYHSDHRQS